MAMLLILLLIRAIRPLRGYSDEGTYVFGGSPAAIEKYPFVAQVWLTESSDTDSFQGAANIIAKRWLLSAAHVLSAHKKYYVKVGSHMVGSGMQFNVEKVIKHEQYDRRSKANDIALVKLSEPIIFSEYMNSIQLAPKTGEFDDVETAQVIGFGRVPGEDGQQVDATALRVATVNVYDFDACTKGSSSLKLKYRNESMICAIDEENKRDACEGDSGGPLVSRDQDETMILIGIVSWGLKNCSLFSSPGYYTRVSYFVNWIKNTIDRETRDSRKS